MPKPHITFESHYSDVWWCEIAHEPGDKPDGPLGMGDTPALAYADWLEGMES